MGNRVTVSISMFVDLKVKEGADITNVINSFDRQCLLTTGEAEVIGADITDRNLVIERKRRATRNTSACDPSSSSSHIRPQEDIMIGEFT